MNSRYPENDIDNIFKSAIEPVETEPSEKFWNQAYEDIIKREDHIYSRQVFRWKTIAYTLGVAILLLAFFTFYINGRINTVQNQVTKVENNEGAIVKNEAVNTNSASSVEDKKNTLLNYNNSPVNSTSKSSATASNSKMYAANNGLNISSNQKSLTRMNTGYSSPGSNIVGTRNALNNGSYGFGGKIPPGNYYANTNGTPSTSENDNSSLPFSSHNYSSLTVLNEQPIVVVEQKPDTILLANTITPNPLTLQAKSNGRQAHSKLNFSHFYASAFFSPEISNNILSSSNSASSSTISSIKNGESNDVTYTTGLRLGFDLSKHWSIFSGAYYHFSSFSIKPTIINAWWNGNESGYNILTSAGTLAMPYEAASWSNDKLNVSGNSTRAYISVPLQVRYNFLPDSKLGFYAEGGFSTNFLLHYDAGIDWESSPTDVGHCDIYQCSGLQKVFFVYNLGAGVTYKFTKSLSVFAEPSMQGPITPFSKNNSITTYSYSFGLAAGLTYHF